MRQNAVNINLVCYTKWGENAKWLRMKCRIELQLYLLIQKLSIRKFTLKENINCTLIIEIQKKFVLKEYMCQHITNVLKLPVSFKNI